MVVTKDEFEEYEKVRGSGVTNMFMVGVVEKISGLSKDKILYIMQNYDELKKKYEEE